MFVLLKKVFFSSEAPIGLISLGVRDKKTSEDKKEILDKLFKNSSSAISSSFAYADFQKAKKAY